MQYLEVHLCSIHQIHTINISKQFNLLHTYKDILRTFVFLPSQIMLETYLIAMDSTTEPFAPFFTM